MRLFCPDSEEFFCPLSAGKALFKVIDHLRSHTTADGNTGDSSHLRSLIRTLKIPVRESHAEDEDGQLTAFITCNFNSGDARA